MTYIFILKCALKLVDRNNPNIYVCSLYIRINPLRTCEGGENVVRMYISVSKRFSTLSDT